MKRLLLLSWLLVAVALPAPPALAGASGRPRSSDDITVADPEDVPPCDTAPDCPEDIRRVTVRTYTGGTGRQMVALRVVVYELHGGLVFADNIATLFDARDDAARDLTIVMTLTERAADVGWVCGSRGHDRFHVIERSESLTCRFPKDLLDPTRSIRFRTLARVDGEDGQFVVDRAPDDGWAG